MGSCYGLLPGMAEAATITLTSDSDYAKAHTDTVTFNGTTVKLSGTHDFTNDDVTGGTEKGSMVLDGATITMGGYLAARSGSAGTLTIQGNSIIQGTEYSSESPTNRLMGTYAATGDATDSHVTIEGASTVKEISGISGGYAVSGAATGNTVTIQADTNKNAPTINTKIRGGVTLGYGEARNNKVTISAGSISGDISIVGGSTKGTASANQVNISGGTIDISGKICGGNALSSDQGNVSNNSVNISGGTIKSGDIYGGKTISNAATNNTINIWGSAKLSS